MKGTFLGNNDGERFVQNERLEHGLQSGERSQKGANRMRENEANMGLEIPQRTEARHCIASQRIGDQRVK